MEFKLRHNLYARLFVLAFGALVGMIDSGFADDRVLIMTIADYERAPLPGAKIDQKNVAEILKLLDVNAANVHSLSDGQLDAKSVKNAFLRLANETKVGDRVFVFFSGHGSSRLIDGRCHQALIAHDMHPVNPEDISQALSAIKDKASKVFMLVDACHSGGVVSNVAPSTSRVAHRLRPKYVSPTDPAEQCSKPINLVEEQIRSMRSARGTPLTNNYLYIAAAQANEVAFDDPVLGGLATSSLLACLKSGVSDKDLSGSVTYRELAQCAQTQIDDYVKGDATIKAHHLSLTGNPDLALESQSSSVSTTSVDPVATLRDLQNASDSRWSVQLNANPPRAKIGKDAFRLTVSSSEDGYLTLIYVGSDGKEFMQLYPDSPGDIAKIKANLPFRIPGEFASQGPVGTNHLLAIVSATPRDFSSIFDKNGVAHASLATASAIQLGTRNLKKRPDRDAGPGVYGAALIQLAEDK